MNASAAAKQNNQLGLGSTIKSSFTRQETFKNNNKEEFEDFDNQEFEDA